MIPSASPLLAQPLPPDPDDPLITCHELTALIALATTAMARPSVLALVGARRLTGLTGAGANGAVWAVTADGTLTITDTDTDTDTGDPR